MIRVLKYTLHDRGTALLPLPRGARALSVADQCGSLQLWVRADSGAPLETRRIAVLFTGFDEVPDVAAFIDTVLSNGGGIVRHVFELPG